MDSEAVVSLATDITSLGMSTDWHSEAVVSLVSEIFSVLSSKDPYLDDQVLKLACDLASQISYLKPRLEFVSLGQQIKRLLVIVKVHVEWKLVSIISQIIFLVSSMDLDSQQKPEESELISLVKQIISLFSSKPDSESELVTLITQVMRLGISVEPAQESELLSLIRQLVSLKSEPELTSLIKQIISRFKSMKSEPSQLISLCPQVYVKFVQGKFRVTTGKEISAHELIKPGYYSLYMMRFSGKDPFFYPDCNGEDHEEYEKAPLEVKHPLHPKHSLRLVLCGSSLRTRECYWCDEDLILTFYYCPACDFAMNIACAEKPPVLSIDHLKWHEHPLSLFSRHTSLTCDVCALIHSNCPYYVCPPCGFVVHQNCLDLPRVIRISRHPHCISFTPSFSQGRDLSCGVCRKKIDNDYGGYSCIKDGCSYAAHSKCATQTNVWDGKELEGEPEEIEEVLEPFVRISEGIIQHFSHEHHHLRLDENTGRDYDESKQCRACITPIYFGNFYSCVECDFILHEKCANLSRKIHQGIHPHMLTLVGGRDGVMNYLADYCSACRSVCTSGFFYECGKEECGGWFKLHVQCAIISEPLYHVSHHKHPLFLTSKPGEWRECGVCKDDYKEETFNCIEGECEFSLCFECATIPQKVRYKHDKHILTLSYGEETSSTITYWCEACEEKINPKRRFYKCDEYCCVTLHIDCLIGEDLYMKPGSSWLHFDRKVSVLPNNHHMSRPICSYCKRRCPHKIVFQRSGLIYCSIYCIPVLKSTEVMMRTDGSIS